MKTKQSLLILSLTMLLASCGGGNTSSLTSATTTEAGTSGATTSQAGTSTTSEGQQSGAETSEATSQSTPEEETYAIAVQVPSDIVLELNKTRAAKGEKIEIKVKSIEQGFELVSLKANNSALTADANGIYSFIMPNRAVTITVELKVNGDVILAGEISVKLEEEVPGSGLYVARNVKVATNAGFSFNAFGKRLSMVDIDHTKCLADIGYTSSNNKDIAMKLAGGSTYDFFYDVNADKTAGRCYVRRVKVDTYPSDPSTLLSLFDGHSRSESTVNPAGVIEVNYANGVTDVSYQWNDYADGSLGVAKKVSDGSQIGINYRKIDSGVYKMADTYLEYKEHRVPGTSDTKKSARLGIVDKTEDIQEGYGRFTTTSHDAEFYAHHSGHATESIRYDLMDSFFIGFESDPDIGTEGLGLNDRKITSEAEVGGFVVTIDSYREIDTLSNVNVPQADKEQSYYKYDATLHFDEASQFLSATYLAKRYSELGYSFATHSIIDPSAFTVVGELNVVYTYGEALGVMNYDDSNLFSSSIEATVFDANVKDPALEGKNAIAVAGDTSSDTVNEHMTLTSNLGEDDAFLDVNNYTIIDYEDSELVYLRSKSDPFTILPRAEGKVNITVGNPMVESAPKYTFELNIEDAIKIRNFYLVGENGPWSASQEQLDTSISFTMPAGRVRRFRVMGSLGDIKNVPFTPVSNDPDIVVSRYVKDNQAYILFDATKAPIDSNKTVKVTLESDRYDSAWASSQPTVITITLVPGSSFNPYGDWYLINSFDESKLPYKATSVNKSYALSVKDYNVDQQVSTLTITGTGGKTATYSFGLHLNEETGLAEVTKLPNGNVSELYLAETIDGYLGIILIANDATWSGLDEVTDSTIVLGNLSYDDEGNLENAEYASFDRAENWIIG